MFNLKIVHRNGIDFRVPVDNFCRFRFDGGGSSSKQTTTSKSPAQNKWMGEALDIYGPSMGQGQEIYQGDRVAPMTETQTQASDVQGFLDRFAPYRDMPMFGETGQALGGLLSGQAGAQKITPEATESYFKGAIEDPRRKAYQQYDKPAIQEAFAGPGYWGSARAQEQSRSAGELSDWLGTERAKLGWDVEQANRNIEEAKAGRALSALGPGMQYGQAPTQNALANLQGRAGTFDLAGAPQRQQQAEINSAIQKFAEENRLTDPEDMQILLALLGMDYSSGSSSQQGPGALSTMFGSAAQTFGTDLGSDWF